MYNRLLFAARGAGADRDVRSHIRMQIHLAHLGGLVRDAFSRDLPRRVLAYPGLTEGVFHPANLQPAVVHPQPDVLQPRV